MRILHIAYSLSESSAPTRMVKIKKSLFENYFFLGKLSDDKYISKKQKFIYIGILFRILGRILDIFFKITFRVNKKYTFSFGFISVAQAYFLKFIIRYYKIDVCHFHWCGFGFFPLKGMIYLNTPIVITAHDFYYFTGGCHVPMDCPQYNEGCRNCPLSNSIFIKNYIKNKSSSNKMILNKINPIIISPSTYVKNKLKTKFENLDIRIIGNNINEEEWTSDLGDDRIFDNKYPILISIGINTGNGGNKGHDTLKDLFQCMYKYKIEANFISIGEFIQLPLNGKRLHFNHSRLENIRNLLSQSDLCLVPSRYETFSQVTLESIVSGTPVVAFDSSGPSDIIFNGYTGFLVNSFDNEKFYKTVVENLDYKRSNLKLFNKYRLKTIEKFSDHKILSSVVKIYTDAINSFEKK